MSDSEMYDLVIVGGGPGGLSAGIYARRAALKTVLVEKGLAGGQINLTESVENYPGFENISGFELSQKFLEHAKSSGLEMIQPEVAAADGCTAALAAAHWVEMKKAGEACSMPGK